MNDQLFFFKIIPRKAIWGGKLVEEYFNYKVPDTTGQVWAFSGQKENSTICTRGKLTGQTLDSIWSNYPNLFNSKYENFPYIISLVAPVEDLSIQVHPTDKVAKEHSYKYGKNEAWVMLDTAKDTTLVYGIDTNLNEFMNDIKQGDFKDQFRRMSTKKGDFFYIPAGTIHALGKGNIAYEVQQSTDLTYRIYDYDRKDESGNTRELNINDALASIESAEIGFNTTFDYVRPNAKMLIENKVLVIKEFISNEYFTINEISVLGLSEFRKQGYLLATVVRGKGTINGEKVTFGDNFIIPETVLDIVLDGDFSLMTTSEKRIMEENNG